MELVETPLDKLSNRALDAVEAGNFKEAERLCKKLLRVYRKAPDGHERMAMLRMAEGRFQEAAHHYGKLLEMIQKNPQHFDPETVQYITEQRDQALAEAARPTGEVDYEDTESADPDSSRAPAPRFRRAGPITAGIARLFRGR